MSHVRSTTTRLSPPSRRTLSSPSSWSNQVLLVTWPSSVVSVVGVERSQGAETRRWYKYSEPAFYIGPSVVYHEPEDYKGKSYTSTHAQHKLISYRELVVPGSSVVDADAFSCLTFVVVALALFPRNRFLMSSFRLRTVRGIARKGFGKTLPYHVCTRMSQGAETGTLREARRCDF